jgi:histidine triad (HIT) family protein
MAYDEANVFAKILRKEMPFIPVYEDGNTLAFMDAMPQADGHVLAIPKEPAETIFDLSDDAAKDLIVTVKMLALAVKAALKAPAIMLMQLNGAAAGQTVSHIHFHVIPRFPNVQLRPHAEVAASTETLAIFAAKIRKELESS